MIRPQDMRVPLFPRCAGRKTGWITTTTRRKHPPEQAVSKLWTADRVLTEGGDVAAACWTLGFSEQTQYRWRNQHGDLKADDAKRLKELAEGNF
jgi:transposase-like protein